MQASLIDLPVKQVVFMEDRVQVKRALKLKIEQGRKLLKLEGVSPFLMDKSVYFPPQSSLQCQNIQVQRRSEYKQGAYLTESRLLYAEREELEKDLAYLEADLTLIKRSSKDLGHLRNQLMKEIELDVSRGKANRQLWQQNLSHLNEQRGNQREQKLELLCRKEKLSREVASKNLKLEALQQQFSEKASLIIDLYCDQEGEYEIQLEYLVPCACWRPSYTAILQTKNQKITMISGATLWQNTGEDWHDVEVLLSTQRSSLGTEIPELTPDYLYTQRKDPRLTINYSEEEVSELSEIEKIYKMPGIDDGGEIINLTCPERMSLSSDAYPVKLDLSQFETEAHLRCLAYPELLESVTLQSHLVNDSNQRLLAGPVELIKDGGFIGQTKIEAISPGEKFSLDWGADEYLVLKRTTELSHEDKLLSTWRLDKHEVLNYISNLSQEPKSLTLIERVPVSDIEQVKIELDDQLTTEAKQPDKDGFIEWQLNLEGRAHQKLELHYRTKKKNEVIG